MQINVTENHINQGQRGMAYHDPISIAVFEQTGRKLVLNSQLRQNASGKYAEACAYQSTARFELPIEVWQKSQDFHAGKGMQPFSFEFDITPLQMQMVYSGGIERDDEGNVL